MRSPITTYGGCSQTKKVVRETQKQPGPGLPGSATTVKLKRGTEPSGHLFREQATPKGHVDPYGPPEHYIAVATSSHPSRIFTPTTLSFGCELLNGSEEKQQDVKFGSQLLITMMRQGPLTLVTNSPKEISLHPFGKRVC